MNLPLPICAVCNRPVEKMVWYSLFSKPGLRFIAHCHGETDSTDVFMNDLVHVTQTDMRPGLAFKDRAAA